MKSSINKKYIDVIDDTLKTILAGKYEDDEGVIHDLLPGFELLEEGSVMLSNIPKFRPDPSLPFPPYPITHVTVENKDTYEKASEENWRENCICLNMASEYVPGGGVLNGSRSQEEELCRRSTLLRSLYMFTGDETKRRRVGLKYRDENLYPLSTFGAIYSPSVEVIKDKDYKYLSQPFFTNVISAAAIRKPILDERGRMLPEDVLDTINKIRMVFRLAGFMGKRKLVLGAWGCGAFSNPPEMIADIFRSVMKEEEFKGLFSDICFAILNSPWNNKCRNFEIFKSYLHEKE